jgi:hypothetical protein
MAVINWLGANNPNKSGPEKYAPPNRRAAEKLSDIDDQATADAVEGEIHEIIGRLRAEDATTVPTTVTTVENVNELIGRVSGASMEEIDRVILELQGVRDMLHSEGDRVSREIANYASLSRTATTAMKVITDGLSQWKSAPDKSRPR